MESTQEQEAARKIFAGPCDFTLSVADLAQLPEPGVPEIAFAGRSNVGKSSLLNALTGRKLLARTSHTPGRTRLLNFFDLAQGAARIVDMPGYGYARVSKGERRGWDALLRAYVRGRADLRAVLLLVDGRHGMKDSDHEFLRLLDEGGVAARVVLTKSDKIKRAEADVVTAATAAALKKHPSAFPHPALVSAHKGGGIPELRTAIAGLCGLV